MEMDSQHADTIVLGRNAIVLQHTNRVCDVAPYADSYEPITGVPIVRGATAVTSQTTGKTYILGFNEAIWMVDHLDHSLLNPNQMRHHGFTVQDNPDSNVSLHIAPYNDEFILPVQADGTTIFFDSRTPTNQELVDCPHIELSPSAPWYPCNVRFPEPAHRAEEEHPIHGINERSSDRFREMNITRVISDRLIA
jgi:hypothetical protein